MGKIFNRVVLVIVAGVYLLFLLLSMFAKIYHVSIAQTTLTIGMYVRFFFYAYLVLYLIYNVFKMSKARNK